MILGNAGRKSGHFCVGPYFPEEVVYMEDHIVKAVQVVSPGHYTWDFVDGKLFITEVPDAKE